MAASACGLHQVVSERLQLRHQTSDRDRSALSDDEQHFRALLGPLPGYGGCLLGQCRFHAGVLGKGSQRPPAPFPRL
ncbi:hypothetical protein ACFQ0G_42735 [Streptomyces chiangmaiensis]